jgi:protein TonB
MLNAGQQSVRDRVGSALGAVLMQVALASMFLWGLGADLRGAVEAPLRVFDVLPPPPPPEVEKSQPPPRVESDTEKQRFTPDEEGGSAPPNIRSTATEIVAPPPRVQLPVPTPIVAAPVPNVGAAPTQGAAPIRGPGTGSGGFGDGTGSGAGGGGGGGGGYGRLRPPRLIRGRLRNSDYPEELGIAGVQGTVGVIFTVLPDGRAVDCRIRRSSGHRVLDEMTCGLIERRYFYEPSRDWRGRPIVSHIVENHTWAVEEDFYDPPPPRRRRGW